MRAVVVVVGLAVATAMGWVVVVGSHERHEDACLGYLPTECDVGPELHAGGPGDAVSFDASACPGGWRSSINELQGGPGTASTVLGAIIAEVDSGSFADVPEDTRRIVTEADDDGFLAVDRDPEGTTYDLVLDGVARGSMTIERFGEFSFGSRGATWCVASPPG